MAKRLTNIADYRSEYSHLSTADEVYFLIEYHANSPTRNSSISNIKKPLSKKGLPEWPHKMRSMREFARTLREIIGEHGFSEVTFVPVPPSQAPDDPMHDDRIKTILELASNGFDSDIRELFVSGESREKAHHGRRRSPDEHCSGMIQNPSISPTALRDVIVVFDDVITTGSSFVAMRRLINEYITTHSFPTPRKVAGIYLARTIHDNRPDAFSRFALNIDDFM